MNIFVYDESLKNSLKQVRSIENNLNSLGLNGKIIYDSSFTDRSIQLEVLNGAKTIISVGNNQTLHRIINSVMKAQIKEDLIFGIIPVGQQNSIANSLGIKDEKSACQIILARRIEKIDIARAGEEYFLESAKITSDNTNIEIDDYSIKSSLGGEIVLNNLCSTKNYESDPQDGLLEIVVNSKNKNNQFLKIDKALIKNQKNSLLTLDGISNITTPVKIAIIKRALNFIVGKERYFNPVQ
jgi:diacylglycerol kinase family enzyme